jgi:hypothetical protein
MSGSAGYHQIVGAGQNTSIAVIAVMAVIAIIAVIAAITMGK